MAISDRATRKSQATADRAAALADHERAATAEVVNTSRLRALRLAKEAADVATAAEARAAPPCKSNFATGLDLRR